MKTLTINEQGHITEATTKPKQSCLLGTCTIGYAKRIAKENEKSK